VKLTTNGWRIQAIGILFGLVALISGCADAVPPETDSGTGATPVAQPKLTVSLSSPLFNAGDSVTVSAVLRNAAGAPVDGVVVTFSTDPIFGTLTPAGGTDLTDKTGTASVKLAAVSTNVQGAATVVAVAQLDGVALTAQAGYSIGAANVAIGPVSFGVNPLSALGSTGVSVSVSSAGKPLVNQQVSFSSRCTLEGKASLPASAQTNEAGVASASYQDNGCGSVDRITASVSGLASSTADLTVNAPTAGAIQFVSAQPTSIGLRGGGPSQSSTVRFKLVDAANNPVGGRTVGFALSTASGGITLSAPSAISSAQTGEVQVQVTSGTLPTPVRVIATTGGPGGAPLTTQSEQLSISVGLPDQDSFSLSATVFNIEGLSVDGEETLLTVRLADVYNNPVPDGTAINFQTEGGRIGSATTGSCVTKASACTVSLTSQSPRPADGRVTVVAYATGEESFADNSVLNGKADTGEYQNVGEVFLDRNFNGVRDFDGLGQVLEPAIDFNGNGQYDTAAADPLYNGSMCNSSCSTRTSTHVWGTTEIVFSGSSATFIRVNGQQPNSSLDISGASSCNRAFLFPVSVGDINGNPLPAGSTVTITTTNGTITAGGTHTVQNDTRRVFDSGNGTPLRELFSVEVKNDSVEVKNDTASTCEDDTPFGTLRVVVRSPRGEETIALYTVIN
jgi:hypothetical protein